MYDSPSRKLDLLILIPAGPHILDPRGVGRSTPRVDCFQNPAKFYTFYSLMTPIPDAHPGDDQRELCARQSYNARCEATMASSRILEHIGSTYDARDLLELVGKTNSTGLRYWGLSYGTVIGGVFAALYPDKVERIVNDGNVNLPETFGDMMGYVTATRDVDQAADFFFEACSRAPSANNSDGCAIYEKTPAAVRARFDAIANKTLANPPVFSADDADFPAIATWSGVRAFFAGMVLHQPDPGFRSSRSCSRPLEAYNPAAATAAKMPTIVDQYLGEGTFPSNCAVVDDNVPLDYSIFNPSADANFAINCANAEPVGVRAEDFVAWVDVLKKLAPEYGDTVAAWRLLCAGRKTRPKWRYTGKRR